MTGDQRGVTLIEALIATAIIGLVVMGAFMAVDNVKESSARISHYDATRQVEQLMRTETTRALHELIESGGTGASVCALTPDPASVGKAAVLSLQPFTSAAVPAGAPKEWTDMRARCAAGNKITGAKGRMCFRLAFTDAKLNKRFPNAAVEVTVALRNQVGGGTLDCSNYRAVKTRGFHLFYSIFYAKKQKDDLDFRTFSGPYYGGGANEF